MDHRPDAAIQVFGQIHELSDAIKRRLTAHGWEPLQYTGYGGPTEALSKKGRRYLLSAAWPRVCAVLDGIDNQEQLSSHSRLLLRVCLGHAHHFVGIVLHHFYERSVLERLLVQKNVVLDLYSDFVSYAKNNTDNLRLRLISLEHEKHELAEIRTHLSQAYRGVKFHVYRVSYSPYMPDYSSPSLGRLIVVDPPDRHKFLYDDFYIMDSADSFVLQALQDQQLEVHLFVTDECPFDSEQLKKIMRARILIDGRDYFHNKWLTVVIIYNLFVVPIVNTWLLKARRHLLENIRTRSYITRLPNKEDAVVTGACPSRMVSVGNVANQVGGVGPYLNIPKGERMETSVKLEILESADFVLDGLVVIADVLFPAVVDKWRTDATAHNAVP